EQKGKDEGILMGSGFIAGEGLMGVVIAIIAVIMSKEPKFLQVQYPTDWMAQIASLIPFVILGWIIYSVAARSRRAA
ncbi:MAG: hypothetical protein ABIA59_06755, partial [Candidatus Latescibacterota bacterium]